MNRHKGPAEYPTANDSSEPEGDEGMTDVQKARCIAYREGFGDGYDYARETDPPTDEPVSREGERAVREHDAHANERLADELEEAVDDHPEIDAELRCAARALRGAANRLRTHADARSGADGEYEQWAFKKMEEAFGDEARPVHPPESQEEYERQSEWEDLHEAWKILRDESLTRYLEATDG